MQKLLIVDDNENNRDVLSDALDTGDYELFEAADGREALKHVGTDPPDLILLDIEMPVMDGMETLKKLKENESTEHIPVIMVTALNTDSQISTCLDHGAVDHIVKPFSNVVVRARVRSALREKGRSNGAADGDTSRGRVVTFMGCKGGVGTTTLAISTAAHALETKSSVVACELRPDYGTMVSQLALSPVLNLNVLLDEESGTLTRQKLRDCLTTHPCGVRALLGSQSSETLLDITPQQAEAIVSGLSNTAEFTVIDLPHTPWEYTAAVLRHSDYVVLTLETDPTSLAAARKQLERLASLGIGNVAMGAVVIKRSAYSSSMPLNDLRDALDCKLIGVIPCEPDACLMAARVGAPVVTARPDSSIAAAYSTLAMKLVEGQVAELFF